jgi:hypothetical protein
VISNSKKCESSSIKLNAIAIEIEIECILLVSKSFEIRIKENFIKKIRSTQNIYFYNLVSLKKKLISFKLEKKYEKLIIGMSIRFIFSCLIK